jgi:hypothetical protein
LPCLTTCLDEMIRLDKALPDRIVESIHPGMLLHMDKKLKQAKVVNDFLVFQGLFVCILMMLLLFCICEFF